MKGRVLILTLLAVFAVASTAPTGQTKSAEIVEFTATETFDPLGLFGPAVGEFLDQGTVKCPGGAPTGDPLQPCPTGGRGRKPQDVEPG